MLKELVTKNAYRVLINSDIKISNYVQLSYLLPNYKVFSQFRKHEHPNRMEHEIIVSELSRYFQNIILTDYRFNGKVRQLDMIFGFGCSTDIACDMKIPLIYYATGCSPSFQTKAISDEIQFINELGLPVKHEEFRHLQHHDDGVLCRAEKIYSIGSDWTASTYGLQQNRVRRLPGIALGFSDDSRWEMIKERRATKKNILWIGSKGVLHKGIHVAGLVAKRLGIKLIAIGIGKDSMNYVHQILQKIGCDYEITGHITVGGSQWNFLMKDISISIGCSISEGMSTSLLTSGLYGVIPVSLESCGLEIGHVCKSQNQASKIDALVEASDRFLSMTQNDLIEKSQIVVSHINTNNSPKSYETQIRKYLEYDISYILNGSQ